jgi:hypothetical protein
MENSMTVLSRRLIATVVILVAVTGLSLAAASIIPSPTFPKLDGGSASYTERSTSNWYAR